ncbi:MAG: hypothetical protein KR126chlam4_01284 [Candidatus Anoxychlamydiales bacterium]|uniref:SprT-like domain-containing protein n=1 Tax=marine sediment metagenome TaxID=412755 RepID=A0A0F9HSN7_9ZZZZ|nr:hypothetical protein [Candidatus Anoxychlamydiales bacterium]NGX41443.1 hypothetical protein [Candidatus Anoxychlamydiales bacterium]
MMNIKEALEKKSNLAISLKVKDYKSTFISVLKTRSNIQISLHKLFLDAPDNVKEAVVIYCLKRDKKAHSIIKKYANIYFSYADYTHRLNVKNLKFKGEFFDLKQIMENLNLIYFKGALNLNITWFEKPKYRKFRHITFGSFDKNSKLVRINRMLDRADITFYFINYIVYHEMLHYVCKEIIDEDGKRKIHTKEFKNKEKEFAYYKEAKEFEKKFLNKGKRYGRS